MPLQDRQPDARPTNRPRRPRIPALVRPWARVVLRLLARWGPLAVIQSSQARCSVGRFELERANVSSGGPLFPDRLKATRQQSRKRRLTCSSSHLTWQLFDTRNLANRPTVRSRNRCTISTHLPAIVDPKTSTSLIFASAAWGWPSANGCRQFPLVCCSGLERSPRLD